MPQPYILNNWQNGIADSPYQGFADMRCVDIYSEPGILKLALLSEKKSSTTVKDIPRWMILDYGGNGIFAVDNGNNVYSSTNSGSTWSDITGSRTVTSGSGNGAAIWKNYLFAIRNTAVDVYGPLNSSPSWTNGFQTLTNSKTYHPCFVSRNDKLYIGDGNQIASIQENTGKTFAPGDATTFTWSANALDVSYNHTIKSMGELGKNLLSGTYIGQNIYDFKTATIFPWDKDSPSFDSPLAIGESGVNQILVDNNIAYCVVGIHGKVYITNGSSMQFLKKIPESIYNFDNGYFIDVLPGAIMVHDGRMMFGVANGTSGALSPRGIWSVNGDKLLFENQASNGSGVNVQIGSLLSISSSTYAIGWGNSNSSTYGIDIVGFSSYRISDATYATSYVDGPFQRVQDKVGTTPFKNLQIELDSVLTTGQGVRVSYRTNISDSFTTLKTFDYTTDGGLSSRNYDIDIPSAENLQLRVALTTGASSTTSPRVLEVKVS